MHKKVFCNWKTYLGVGETQTLAAEIVEYAGSAKGIVLLPSAEVLESVAQVIEGTSVEMGAQVSSTHRSGAYTGQVSPENLHTLGCRYVLVGHSEQRAAAPMSAAHFMQQATTALEVGLMPVICVGETREQRNAGDAAVVVREQLRGLEAIADPDEFFIAYEPVWAVGTGETATVEDVVQMCEYIKSIMGERTAILYGGSLTAENVGAFAEQPLISGFLIGGASTKVTTLFPILDVLRSA